MRNKAVFKLSIENMHTSDAKEIIDNIEKIDKLFFVSLAHKPLKKVSEEDAVHSFLGHFLLRELHRGPTEMLFDLFDIKLNVTYDEDFKIDYVYGLLKDKLIK